MPQYHSICKIPAKRRKGEEPLQELINRELLNNTHHTALDWRWDILTPEIKAQINSVIESAKSKIIREFRNLYPLKTEVCDIIKEGVKYMKDEYKKLRTPYVKPDIDKELAFSTKKLEELFNENIDKSPKRREFNLMAIDLIYDQVPERIATILSIGDPKGRSKYLAEQEYDKYLAEQEYDKYLAEQEYDQETINNG